MTDGPEGSMPEQQQEAAPESPDPVACGADAVPVVPTCEAVPDEIPLCIPRGGQVLVIGGLRLAPGGTDISREIARTIAPAIEACRGPGVVILNGDTFDLLRDGRPDADPALASHPRLAAALSTFLDGPERRIVLLPSHGGNFAPLAAALKGARL